MMHHNVNRDHTVFSNFEDTLSWTLENLDPKYLPLHWSKTSRTFRTSTSDRVQQIPWNLELNLRGDPDDRDGCGMTIGLQMTEDEEVASNFTVNATYTISIVGEDLEPMEFDACFASFGGREPYWASSTHVDRDTLARNIAGGSCTIVCELSGTVCCEKPSAVISLDINDDIEAGVLAANRRLYESKSTMDLRFICSDEKCVMAHKCILAANSHVFEAMFASDMQERSTGMVTLSDFTSSVVAAALETIYCGTNSSTDSVASHFLIMSFAHKYNIGCLSLRCEKFIASKVVVGNAMNVLTDAATYDNCKLIDYLVDYIVYNVIDVLKLKDFEVQARNVPTCIMSRINRILNEFGQTTHASKFSR